MILKEFFKKFKAQIFSKIILILIFVLTLATSGVAASKVITSFQDTGEVSNGIVKGASVSAAQINQNNNKKDVSISPTGVLNRSSNINNKNSPLPTGVVSIRSPTVTPSSINTAGNCIITLFGNRYDITTLRQAHSGGNVFNCGADMTAVYQGRHGTNVSRMQIYLVNSKVPIPTSGSGGNPIPIPTSVVNSRRGDEDD